MSDPKVPVEQSMADGKVVVEPMFQPWDPSDQTWWNTSNLTVNHGNGLMATYSSYDRHEYQEKGNYSEER